MIKKECMNYPYVTKIDELLSDMSYAESLGFDKKEISELGEKNIRTVAMALDSQTKDDILNVFELSKKYKND